jgi:hypothetical protein
MTGTCFLDGVGAMHFRDMAVYGQTGRCAVPLAVSKW